jgi:AAA+ ATPase superfamily predicted ATPase
MEFYNRKKELSFLKSVIEKDSKQFIVLYGRRRIGKTTLLKKTLEAFSHDKFLYYFVQIMKEETVLNNLSHAFSKAIYTEWYDLFSDLFRQKEIIVFDEFQNFNRINPSILAAFQHAWDDHQNQTKLFILGSYVGMMKKIFTDGTVPLFGRNDYMIRIGSFSQFETLKILTNYGYSITESIEILMLVGGIPRYLLAFKEKNNLKEKIYELFIDDFAPFKEETKNILIQEFGKIHKSYFSILKSIGAGRKSLSEISDISGIERTSLSKFLSELEYDYELIKKTSPILSKKMRDNKYEITDKLYSFYFNIIDRYFSDFEFDTLNTYERIYPNLPNHFGIMFETICEHFLIESRNILPFFPEKIGKHWGKKQNEEGKKEAFDIDIVAYDSDNILFCECKWKGKKIGFQDYLKLKTDSSYVNSGNKKQFYALFSKNGFTKELEDRKIENLLLFKPDDFLGGDSSLFSV